MMRPKDRWASIRGVEIATAEWVDWYNRLRPHGEIGLIPPAEYESAHWDEPPAASYARDEATATAAA